MSKILNLEELLKQQDVKNTYGEKAEGFVKLKKKLQMIDFNDYDVEIPDLFAIPVGYDSSDIIGMKKVYDNFTKKYNSKRMLFVRSSDPNETSGKFDSTIALYDPENPLKSFKNWKKAFDHVLSSGAKTSLTQIFPNEMKFFPTSINWGYDDINKKDVLKKTGYDAFGSEMVSFYINSTSPIHDDSIMTVCEGLGTKIADSSNNSICTGNIVLFYMDNKMHVINGEKFNYHQISSSNRLPSSRDLGIINGDNVKIEHISRASLSNDIGNDGEDRREKIMYQTIDRTLTPFMRKWSPNSHNPKEVPEKIFKLFNQIKSVCESEIEIEGIFDGKKIYLHQLRHYDIPKNKINNLSEVNPASLIHKENNNVSNYQAFNGELSMGNGMFRGDLYITDKLIDIPEGGILFYSNKHFADLDVSNFIKYDKVIMTTFQKKTTDKNSYLGIHSLGRTYQLLTGLEKQNISALTLGPNFLKAIDDYKDNNTGRKSYLENGVTILHDVAIECTGLEAQIYCLN